MKIRYSKVKEYKKCNQFSHKIYITISIIHFSYQKLGILFHSNVNHNTNDSLEFRYVENVSNQKFTEVTKITNELLIAKLNYYS